jgi:hypothetical protein
VSAPPASRPPAADAGTGRLSIVVIRILLPSDTTTIPPDVEDGIGESADDATGNYGACRGSVLLRTGICVFPDGSGARGSELLASERRKSQ